MENLNNDFSLALFIWQILLLLSIILWIYCLIDILKNTFIKNDKIVWIIVVIFVPIIGSILYLLIGKNRKLKIN